LGRGEIAALSLARIHVVPEILKFQKSAGREACLFKLCLTGTKARIQVEEEKPAKEQGFYLSPGSFEQSEEKGVAWARAHREKPIVPGAKAYAENSGGQEAPPPAGPTPEK
jgi:hypothetical protein